jgi:hypothetical protein
MTPMNTTSTPSAEVTKGQIGKVQELLGAVMGKHAAELPSDAIQLVIEQEGEALQSELLVVIRKRVENRTSMIVRKVTVNRDQNPQQMLDATKRAQYTDKSVVNGMPTGGTGTEEVMVEFFTLGRYVSDEELEREYAERGLTPDPYAQGQVNADDPVFADDHPNGTHWQNADGKWCFATFDRGVDERCVGVDRRGIDWGDFWWFGGVRK